LPLGEALPVVTMRISGDCFLTNQILMQFAVRFPDGYLSTDGLHSVKSNKYPAN
jgi:hypothetical protein